MGRLMKKIFVMLCALNAIPFVYGDGFGNTNSTDSGAALNSGASTSSSSSGLGGIVVPPIVSTANLGNGISANNSDNGVLAPATAAKDSNVLSLSPSSPAQQTGISTANSRASSRNNFDPFVNNVYIRTGLKLSKYGADLFQTPTSFAPAQNIPVPSRYVIAPGDSMQIQTWGAVNGDMNTTVSPSGTIFVPKLGEVSVTGVKAGELDGYLKQKVGKIYRNFDLSATVNKVRSIQVTVAGMANQPGTYTLSSLSTMSNAIMAVGGPSGQGSLRDVELKRHGVVVDHFDMYNLLLRGDNSHDSQILAGDVIVFKPVGGEVAIYDGVKQPAIYEVKPGETVRDLVNFAGGYSSDANTDKVVIETIADNQAINVNSYQTATAQSYSLTGGEIVHFFRTSNKYENSVAVIGNVINPTRTAFKNGMTVRDLIPDKEALLTRSYYNSFASNTYGRDNVLTQADVEKTTGQSSSGGLNLTTGLQSSQNLSNGKPVFGGGENLFTAGPVSIPEANINWNYALIVRVNPENYSTRIIPFNLRKAIAGDSSNNIRLKPGDIVNVLSAKDVRTSVFASPIYVFVDGEVYSPGVYELKAGQTLRDAIESAGGVTPSAYVFGMELDRNSVKKQQTAALNQMLDQAQQAILAQSTSFGNITSSDQANLQQMAVQQQMAFINKMRQIQPAGRVVLNLQSASATLANLPNFKLENGDTIYIPPTPDTINVVGQVYNPATFIYQPHYSVGNYIEMAGTENQYADKSVEYVLRADGTLYSKQQAGWFGAFASRTLNPGDVIIVPQQIQFGGTVQNLINWTQVLANFGTAAAAITVFK